MHESKPESEEMRELALSRRAVVIDGAAALATVGLLRPPPARAAQEVTIPPLPYLGNALHPLIDGAPLEKVAAWLDHLVNWNFAAENAGRR